MGSTPGITLPYMDVLQHVVCSLRLLSIHSHFDPFVLLPMAIITFICDCTTTRFSSFYNLGLQVMSYSYPYSLSCMHKGQERTLLAHYEDFHVFM